MVQPTRMKSVYSGQRRWELGRKDFKTTAMESITQPQVPSSMHQ